MSNFGDDLFGVICQSSAKRYWHKDSRLVGPPIPLADTQCTIPSWFPVNLYGGGGKVGQTSRLVSFLHATATADILALGGGSIVTSRSSFRRPLMIAAQRIRNLRLAAVGISIGPFEGARDEQNAANFLENFSYISVRDKRSYDCALAMGLEDMVHSGRDLAGLIGLVLPNAATQKMRGLSCIGVSLCNYSEGAGYAAPKKGTLSNALATAISAWRAGTARVYILVLNEHSEKGDRELSKNFQVCLAARGVDAEIVSYRKLGLIETINKMKECDAIISARLHGAIVAYMLGIPFAIVDYHSKCADFADDVGLSDVQRITASRSSAEDLATTIDAILNRCSQPVLNRAIYAQEAAGIFENAPWCN